ncbi:Cna B-type domain-containing protein [Paenibacillus mesophilus]|uniref:Cna B-type domain-containing protein n=1 Tax=Paenibacillus mesophilus TaxID=2582849 RepID=UPI00110EDC7D|nr:Cna B-type domain-containing protein [Paenibacillus mesophilus]TMV47012.1 Cna B-type domain-containing protein [Paenibacillus mesophilus]
MKKSMKYVLAALLVFASLFGVSSAAFADAAMDFEVTAVGYENGVLKATGIFKNTGDKAIDTVNKVDVKIFLYNDAGDGTEAAHQYFSDLKVNLKPSESVEYSLEFTGVPEYVDATKWSAEEGEWEFTYIEEQAAPAPAPAAEPAAEAALDFEVTSVGYENGVLKAIGKFKNVGGKNIDTVNKVDVKIFLYNDAGDGKQVANHYFTDLKVNLKAGEEVEYTLEFTDVPEYTDATKWSAEEGEWEFTYFE